MKDGRGRGGGRQKRRGKWRGKWRRNEGGVKEGVKEKQEWVERTRVPPAGLLVGSLT
jgi:hypothetical protein